MRSDLVLCTLEHVKGVMSPSGCVKSDLGASLSSSDRNGSNSVAGVVKSTNGCVPPGGDEAAIRLGLTVDTLVHTRKTNPSMARKEKRSSVSSGKLVVSGSKHLPREIEDSSSLSCGPSDSSQLSHYDV